MGRGSGSGPASHGSRLRVGRHDRRAPAPAEEERRLAVDRVGERERDGGDVLARPGKRPVRACARPADLDGRRCERCAVLGGHQVREVHRLDAPLHRGRERRAAPRRPDRVLPGARRNGRGLDRHVVAVARRAGDAPGDRTRGDRDGVDRAGPGERSAALRTRRRLIGHDRACEPAGPGAGSDPLAVVLDDERAAVLDQDVRPVGAHAAASVASGVSATAARIASRSSSASQSSAGAAMTFSASSRLDSSSSSIRSSTVAVQIRLET